MRNSFRSRHFGWLLLAGAVGVAAAPAAGCGSDGSSFGGGGDALDGGDGGNGNGFFGDDDGDGGNDPGDFDGGACHTSENAAQLEPIYLGVVFDVSGSMGQLDCPYWWHDPAVKWQPIREATSAFFEDGTASNIHASLTFFPSQGSEETRCTDATYATPDVTMRRLPDPAFSAALDDYEGEAGLTAGYPDPMPIGGASWRGSTPTPMAVTGVLASLAEVRETTPDARLAVVLVTDGLPSGCSGNASLANTLARVTAAREDGISTYVIGVKNPADPPARAPWVQNDTRVWACFNSPDNWRLGYSNTTTPYPDTTAPLTNLGQIAEAGGTTSAFLIDTGNPNATKTAFLDAINDIRRRAVSCELKRPDPPAGQTFDPAKVNVRYDSGSKRTPLGYDPTCAADDAWRYKGTGNDVIELCPSTCAEVQADPQASIKVEFGCVRRGAVN